MAHTLGAVWVESGYFETMTGARIGNGSDPRAASERTRGDARAALSAIRAAQEARKASDAAAEKRAAAEKAADDERGPERVARRAQSCARLWRARPPEAAAPVAVPGRARRDEAAAWGAAAAARAPR